MYCLECSSGTASMSYLRRACSIGSVFHASVMRGCVLVSASSSLIYHFWFLKHHHSAMTQLSYPWTLHAHRANNNYFLYIFLFFCSMYLVLFSIVLYRTIVTVYSDNIFIYNYIPQMHQIIHLSLVGCFTLASGKSVQKIVRLAALSHSMSSEPGSFPL